MGDAMVQPAAEQEARTRFKSRTDDAFMEAERQGLMLAAKVRTIGLLVVVVWQIVDSPDRGLSYAYGLMEILCFVLLGLLQYACAKRRFYPHVLKYVFVLVDCALLAIVLTAPDPFDDVAIPAAVAMDSGRAVFFLILLMQAAFSLRPHLVLWCGFCIVAARIGMLVWFVRQPDVFTNLDLAEQGAAAFLNARSDPNFIFLGFLASEVIVSAILATGLAVLVTRSRNLVERQSAAERTRASLARYFSPNVVDHISQSKENLHRVQQQDVAVMFVDIIGFTSLCENAAPDKVIRLLQDYHNRLGQAVFDNGGTLDKYIGDGLMATFGTPEPNADDAANALKCALDMIAALQDWNLERSAAAESPVRVGIGVHYGEVIVGDIGNARRLEYSVIGDTVNIASRLEQLTRGLGAVLVVSDSLVQAIDQGSETGQALLRNLTRAGVQNVRGRESAVAVWALMPTEAPQP